MPKTRRRTYKSRRRKTMRRKPRAKKTRSKFVTRCNPPKYVSLNSLYKVPYTRDQTITQIVSTIASVEDYQLPQVAAENKVSTIIAPDDTAANLQQYFETRPGAVPTEMIPEFRRIVENFRQIKINWIRVTLTPEHYFAIAPGGVSTGDEKDARPVDLYYINDNGSASLSLGNPQSILIEDLEKLSDYQHGKIQFTRPVQFYITPYEKLAASKTSPNFTTFKQWTDTQSETDPNLAGTTYIPNDNFYYGFTTVDRPADFRFKVKVEASVTCKDFKLT